MTILQGFTFFTGHMEHKKEHVWFQVNGENYPMVSRLHLGIV